MALILNNNFNNAASRSVDYGSLEDSLTTAQIFGNILGDGVGFRGQLASANSFGWFLGNNTYLNATSNTVAPFLDPASSAIHIFN
jgi:hypothetical protein